MSTILLSFFKAAKVGKAITNSKGKNASKSKKKREIAHYQKLQNIRSLEYDSSFNPFALGLGSSSFYNHACPANAVYEINRHRRYIKITAERNIDSGEEVTINYNGNPFDTSVVQFTPNPMAQ